MAMVRAGASRQECHEEIRVLSQEAASGVKLLGRDNDLIERVRNHPYFAPIQGQVRLRNALTASVLQGNSSRIGIVACVRVGSSDALQLAELLDPKTFVGRAPEQVAHFLKDEVVPALAAYQDVLSGDAEVLV